VVSINSIQKKYKDLRFDSKAPTFALTYQGTWKTLVTNCGFAPEFAKQIETRYHEMYQVSDAWVQERLTKAQETGYVTIAFGLRLRTPLLAQSPPGFKKSPAVAAEGRTAGNAMGQSYGLLNSRSGMAFLKQVRVSVWREEIRPCGQNHDAQYFMARDDADLLAWANEHLIREVQWQSLPEIEHDQVKLGGELFIFYPSWANEIAIPNGADATQILSIAKEYLKQ
jgi:DNA polymerase-1